VPVAPAALVKLLRLVEDGAINLNSARDVLAAMVDSGRDPAAIVAEQGLAQISDETALIPLVEQIIADNPDALANYLGGKTSLLGWFVGQVMRATQGQANPALVNRLVAERLAAKSRAS
jgi:Asp-tRNA(Asn)/Glu-tRNA(Gln) amidotransferase B subunit